VTVDQRHTFKIDNDKGDVIEEIVEHGAHHRGGGQIHHPAQANQRRGFPPVDVQCA